MANEKRLIDANALICELDEYIQENREQDYCANSFCADVAEIIRDVMVKEIPTVDAVEVVHGRWLYDSGSGKYFCSACDEKRTVI